MLLLKEQVTFWDIDSSTHMYDCKWSFEVHIRLKDLSNTLYIHNEWLQVLRWVQYQLRPQLSSWNKETLYSEKKLFMQLNTVSYKVFVNWNTIIEALKKGVKYVQN